MSFNHPQSLAHIPIHEKELTENERDFYHSDSHTSYRRLSIKTTVVVTWYFKGITWQLQVKSRHLYSYIYIYIHTHTHTHTRTHTHTHTIQIVSKQLYSDLQENNDQ